MYELAILLAQASGGDAGGTNWTDLASYGVLGLVVLGFLFRKIVPGWIYDQVQDQLKHERENSQVLEDTIKERVIPSVLKSTDVMVRVLDLLEQFENERKGGPE